VTYDAPPPTGGLVAAYGFNEGSGTVLTDLSGTGNQGAITAATWTATGKFGGALTFNATSWVTVPYAASLNLTTAMTLEAWVNPSQAVQWGTILMKEQPGNYAYVMYGASPTTPSAEINVGTNDAGQRVLSGTSALPLNAWSHVASTYDGTTLRLYVNGVEVSSRVISAPIVSTASGVLRLGGNGIWSEHFQGQIDEVRIYNRVLSASEIQADLNTPVGSSGPPVDGTAPTIAISAPTSGATYATTATPLTVSGSASDNVGVTQVTWANSAGGSGTATGTTSWSVTGIALQPGSNVITVTARDAANNVATATLTVTYTPADGTAPTVAITAPTSGGTYTTTASPLALGGTASDNVGVTQVTWVNSRGGSGGATGTTSWSVAGIALQPGSNVITVTARDAANNVATATLTVTYDVPDTTLPTVTISAPTGSGSYTTNTTPLTVSGSASDNVGVTQVTWVNSAGGSGTATGTTSWSAAGIVLQSGSNVITVNARDAANNVATATITITLDVTPPSATVVSPAAGATVSSVVAVTVSASDDRAMAGVTLVVDGAAVGNEVTGAGPTYSLAWTTFGVPNGVHLIAARARDSAGNITTSAAVSVTLANTAAGPVAAYGFEESSGSTATDMSGHANNGTLQAGVTRTSSGKIGSALVFNGSSVAVPYSPSLNITAAMTLEALVYPTQSQNWATVIMKEQPKN
jgi:hypothetical protein